jgi:hypothetical protein
MLYIIKKRSGAIEGKGLVERGHRRRPVEAIRLSQVFFGSRNDQKKQAAGILTGICARDNVFGLFPKTVRTATSKSSAG